MARTNLAPDPAAGSLAPTPLPTAATEAFLRHPVLFYRRSARDVLQALARGRQDATAERRAYIEAALERLENLRERFIAKLDAEDMADADLEPWLGRPESFDQRVRDQGGTDEREDDGADFEDNGDYEPSLGSLDAINQRAWAMGGCSDFEDEHSGQEPDCDDEGHEQAPVQLFRDDSGRQIWPPVAAPQ